MKKLAATTVASLFLLGALATPAFAKKNYFDKPTCVVSDSTLAPGDQVTVSGEFWKEGSTVDIILRPEQIVLGTATVGANETFSITVTIPEDIRPGPHKIVCKGRNLKGVVKVKNTQITILGATVTPPAGAAFTGATTNVPLWAGIATILALAGMMALYFARRLQRRRAGPGPEPESTL